MENTAKNPICKDSDLWGNCKGDCKRKRNITYVRTGSAVGSNKIGIIIPCHRVVGANGNLTGYAGGIYNKEALLRLDGVDMSGMYIQQ